MPNIYLGGRISKNDWRTSLIDMPGDCDDLEDSPKPLNGSLQGWNYAGPFFIECDHGCFHGISMHGVGALTGKEGPHTVGPGGCVGANYSISQHQTLKRIERWIRRTDLFYAWLGPDADQAFGTIYELGFAKALKKSIIIGMSEDCPLRIQRDLWVAIGAADEIVIGRHPNETFDSVNAYRPAYL